MIDKFKTELISHYKRYGLVYFALLAGGVIGTAGTILGTIQSRDSTRAKIQQVLSEKNSEIKNLRELNSLGQIVVEDGKKVVARQDTLIAEQEKLIKDLKNLDSEKSEILDQKTHIIDLLEKHIGVLEKTYGLLLYNVITDPGLYTEIKDRIDGDLKILRKMGYFVEPELEEIRKISFVALESPFGIIKGIYNGKVLQWPAKTAESSNQWLISILTSIRNKVDGLPDLEKIKLLRLAKIRSFDSQASKTLKEVIKTFRKYQKSFLIKYKTKLTRIAEQINRERFKESVRRKGITSKRTIREYKERRPLSHINQTMRRRLA